VLVVGGLCDELFSRSGVSYRVCVSNFVASVNLKNEAAESQVALLCHREKKRFTLSDLIRVLQFLEPLLLYYVEVYIARR
jgi:hypothetical protein